LILRLSKVPQALIVALGAFLALKSQIYGGMIMTTTHMHPKMKWTYVGVDSHKATHTVVFMDCFFEMLGEITLGSSPSGFEGFYQQAQQYLQEGTAFAWGFEDTSAYGRTLVKFLINKGELVKHCDASLVASEREAKNILHKTDSVDAECAARVLLNRFDKLPTANPQEKYFILSTLVTRRKFLAKVNMMANKQLHSFIYENYPSYKKFFSRLEGKTSLAFFEAYPSPQALEGVTLEELTSFLLQMSSHFLGEKKARQILELVREDGVIVSEYQETRDVTIQSIARQIQTVKDEVERIDEHIECFLPYFDYDLTQIKGINTITAAMFITEIGDITRFKNASALAKYAGVAPVVHASGAGSINYANSHGNRQLNELFYRLSIIQSLPRGKEYTLINPLFHEYYNKKLSEGKTKKQALKCVQRRLVNIIFSMMKHKREYTDPPACRVSDLKGNHGVDKATPKVG